ncbi:MAG: VOC family protein [Pseudolabrys sp.]|nr:VOC family protein [Pseudolabrys sp.]MDP2295826.1 VOC family protein [Pseudolabrys sp.]
MNDPQAVLSLVTLGVSDLNRSIAFYEALGFARKSAAAEGVGFFQAGACAIAVWTSPELAKDANIAFKDLSPAFRGVSLAWNCRSKAEVDAAMDRAYRAGAMIQKQAADVFWGGYSGYFFDPDGHLWEVAFNPGFPLSDDGRLQLPA